MGATRDCLVEIEQLSAASRSDQRPAILRCVTDLFLITADRQRPPDTAVFGDVMLRLASDVDVPARAELADRLADAPKAPAALIRVLAADIIEVARPLLERSPVLTDADLSRLAATCGLAHSDAISRRARLSSALTDVLARHGDDMVLIQMALNADALISHDTYEEIAARAETNPELRQALLERANAPADILERLRAPQARRRQPKAASPATAGSKAGLGEAGGIKHLNGSAHHSPAKPAIGIAAGPATTPKPERSREEARLADLARDGRFDETVMSLSALTGLAPELVRNCLFTAETPALVVLCKAHDFASTTFSALLQLRQAAGAISTKGIASAMRRYETMDPHMASRIMRFLQVRLANPGEG